MAKIVSGFNFMSRGFTEINLRGTPPSRVLTVLPGNKNKQPLFNKQPQSGTSAVGQQYAR